MDEKAIQKHILHRIELALKGRSWNWLAGKSGVPQSTLQTQKGTPDRDGPRFSLETLLAVGETLGKPIDWFLPGNGTEDAEDTEKDVALIAYREMAAILDWSRAMIQGEIEKARDLAQNVGPTLGRAVDGQSEPTAPPRSSQIPQSSGDPEDILLNQ